jgi:MoaA/NifB/PqqE/SkfB family radical SAM enzyme
MHTFGLRCLGHNLPRRLQTGSSVMCAVRIHNTRDRAIYFQSHASFYAPSVADTRLHLSIHVNGAFVKPVLVSNDCLPSGDRTTLYFAFHADQPGTYQLQLRIAEQHTDPVHRGGTTLLDTTLQVTSEPVAVDRWRQLHDGLFNLVHTELPIRMKALQRYAHGTKMALWPPPDEERPQALRRYKEINRDLAFMEKQVRKTRVTSLPCYLAIDTTSKCNLHCKMCFREYVDIDYNQMPDLPVETLDRLIDELFPTAMTLSLSTLGEPLMSPHLDKILDACVRHQVYLSMTTNATVMRGNDFIARLASVLHYIEISVDSVTPERFKAFRSGASYQKVLQNATKLGAVRRTLPDPKFNMGFSMTLFRENLDELPDMLRLVADIGGNMLKADIGVVFTRNELAMSVLNCPERYNEMYAIAQEQARAAGISLMMRAPFSEPETKAVKYGMCDYLYVSACVRSDGTLSPCYFGPALLGLNDSFRSAWNSEVMVGLRNDHDTPRGHEFCRSCYVFTDGGSSVDNRKAQFLKGDAAAAL